ncbi:MAG: AAA family ATPase [Bacteroidales bacterium]|nr:AAA family ATPase [Bacteroidales bacterium]
MKLLKLELLNLASLDKKGGEVIDFEGGVLKDSTIFSIVGSTGSGKSTILDAICLALYNRAPRYPKDGRQNARKIEIYGKGEEDEDYRLAPTDSRNILSRGKKDGYSKLTFMANDGSIYRAEWSVHFNVKRYDNAITSLYKISIDSGSVHEEEKDWKSIPQIIGLGYDQFLRTVLIAQGSFANFLNAKEDERFELLEKLIGCEQLYLNVVEQIRQRKDEATDAFNLLAADSSACQKDILDGHELEELKEKIAGLEDEQAKVREEMANTVKSLTWYDRQDKYLEDISKYEKVLLTSGQKMEEMVPFVEKLTLHDATLEAVQMYRENYTIQLNINKLNFEIQNMDSEMAARKMKLSEQEIELIEANEALKQAVGESQMWKPHIDKARSMMGELSALIRELQQKAKTKETAELSLTAAVKELEENKSAIAKAEDNLKFAAENLASLDAAIASRRALLEEELSLARLTYITENDKIAHINPDQLQKAKSLAEQQLNDLRNAMRICSDITENMDAIKSNSSTAEVLVRRNLTLDEELRKLDVEALGQKLQTLRNSYTLITSEDWKMHRSKLADNQPCPLCGATHHPYADGAAFAPVVNELYSLIVSETQELDRQSKLKENFSLEKSKNEGKITFLREQNRKLDVSVSKLVSEWKAITQRYPQWPQDGGELEHMLEAFIRDCKSADESLAEYNRLDASVKRLRKTLDIKEKENQDFDARAKVEHDKAQSFRNVAETALKTECGKTDNLVKQLEEKQLYLESTAGELARTQSEMEMKKIAIRDEIGDNNLEELESNINGKVQKTGEAVNARNQVIVKMKEEIQELVGKLATTTLSRDEMLGSLDEKVLKLDRWLDEYNACHSDKPLNINDIRAIGARAVDWESLRQEIKNVENAHIIAQATLNNERKACQQHQQNKPTESKDILSGRKATLESWSNAQLVNAQAILQRHENAVNSLGSLVQKIEDAKLKREAWEKIMKSIGGNDGKKLRKIAQCYTLRFLIEHANEQIRRFNSRYELMQVKNSLGIRIIDHDRADDVRDTTSLSGGETFIVSLGLALGLSALSSRNISFENLFIDEGFGTLDPDTLATVIDSLAMLQSSQGKKVGVISHTDTMSERITTQIRIIKNGNSGSSHIEIGRW